VLDPEVIGLDVDFDRFDLSLGRRATKTRSSWMRRPRSGLGLRPRQ
jgi:hypothetical protein